VAILTLDSKGLKTAHEKALTGIIQESVGAERRVVYRAANASCLENCKTPFPDLLSSCHASCSLCRTGQKGPGTPFGNLLCHPYPVSNGSQRDVCQGSRRTWICHSVAYTVRQFPVVKRGEPFGNSAPPLYAQKRRCMTVFYGVYGGNGFAERGKADISFRNIG